MQSLLQYRRLGREAQQQLQAVGQERPNAASKRSRPSDGAQSLNNLDEKADAEDAEKDSDATLSPSSLSPATSPPPVDDIEKTVGTSHADLLSLSEEEDPKKWTYAYKWTVTGIVGSAGFVVAWASAVDSEVAPQIVEQFGVGQEVALLGTTLFMVTFGLGSLISAPFSEVVGRNPVYLISLVIFGLFTMGAGLATDIETYLVCRSFAGLFGCPPLTNFGGTTADLWTPTERTYVFPVLACLSFLGPFLAPMVADFVGPSPLVSWQWTEWLTLIFTGALVAGIFFFAPETYAPVIQSWKASQLRKISGDDSYMTDKEKDSPPFGTRLLRSVYVPIKFLFTEPITDLFALYLVILYIILFGFLPGFQFIFGEEGIYGFDQNHTGLCFIPMNVGFLLAFIPIFPIYRRFKRKMREEEARGKDKVVPEERLLQAMIAGPCLPISLFWLGWTSWPSVSFWSPLIASVLFGFSVMGIFISCYQYIIDSYETMAASALVGMTLLRYCASGPMVIVSLPMYTNLGVHWTLTLLGCLSALMAPVPFIFYFGVGAWARKKSKNATSFE